MASSEAEPETIADQNETETTDPPAQVEKIANSNPDDENDVKDDEKRDGDKSCSEQLVQPDGTLNWDYVPPCFDDVKDTPCWESFKVAYSCTHYSEAVPKGIDCLGDFKEFMACVSEHPDMFPDEWSSGDTEADPLDDPLNDPRDNDTPDNLLDLEEEVAVDEKA